MSKRTRIATVWPPGALDGDPLLPQWPQRNTWQPMVRLLTRTAMSAGHRIVRIPRPRAELENIPGRGVRIVGPKLAFALAEAEQFDLKAIVARLSSTDRMAVREGQAVPEAMVERYAHEIYAAIRSLYYNTYARVAWQRRMHVSGRTERRISINWRRQPAPLAQLHSLALAAGSNSPYQWERAWLALTASARRHLHAGFEEARGRGAVREFRGELERDGEIIGASVPTPEFVQLALPQAIRVASRSGRPRMHPEDSVFAAILDIFVMLTVPRAADRVRRGIVAAAFRGGVPFVREVEEIFHTGRVPELTLIAGDDERAFWRARPLMTTLPPRRRRR